MYYFKRPFIWCYNSDTPEVVGWVVCSKQEKGIYVRGWYKGAVWVLRSGGVTIHILVLAKSTHLPFTTTKDRNSSPWICYTTCTFRLKQQWLNSHLAYERISILTLFLWELFHTTLALHSGVKESVYLVCDAHHITLPASDNEKNNIDCW